MLKGMSIVVDFIIILFVLLYFIGLENKYGQTLGKKLVNIKVVKDDGSDCDMKSSVIRNILRIIDNFLFFSIVGIIAIIATDENQRVGDMAGNTLVVPD
jgi:uncharacterized RDD family membrane protein YckC